VFNLYYKHADLPDNPPQVPPTPPFFRKFDQQQHLYDYDQPEMLTVLAEIRAILDQYPERFAVGETFPENAESAVKYSTSGLLHEAFNFEFTHCPWLARPFMAAVQRYESLLAPDQHPCYVLGNHDLARPATRYAKGEDDSRLKVAAALLLTLRGTPFIYYGDEIGQRDIPIRKKEDILDPIGKSFFPFFKGRDGCRAPMQWDDSSQAGFTTGTPWLPVHANSATRNVAAQQADPDSLLNFYKQLLALRKAHPALHRGSLTFLQDSAKFILTYLRAAENDICLVALNFSSYERELILDNFIPRDWNVLLSTEKNLPLRFTEGVLTLKPNQVLILHHA
jgi:alpha-glucosidase